MIFIVFVSFVALIKLLIFCMYEITSISSQKLFSSREKKL